MAYIDMKKTDWSKANSNSGAIYHEKIVLADSEVSDVYLFPTYRIYDIAVNLDGDGILEVTNSSPKNVKAGNATWAAWEDGFIINKAVTAFKVTSTSGEVTLEITAKTDKG